MDKKQLMVIEKYTQPFVQLVFEKGEQDLVFLRKQDLLTS